MAKRKSGLTHLDSKGRPAMVDVSTKAVTAREATAECRVRFPADVARQLRGQLLAARADDHVAARIAERLALLSSHERQLIEDAVQRVGPLPSTKTLALDDIISAMAHDKKAEAGHTAFVLPTAIGRVIVRADVPLQIIRSALRDTLFEQPF